MGLVTRLEGIDGTGIAQFTTLFPAQKTDITEPDQPYIVIRVSPHSTCK